jgi:hypothetical protein
MDDAVARRNDMRPLLAVGMLITTLGFWVPIGDGSAHAGQSEAATLGLMPRPVPVSPTPDPLNIGCRDFRNRPVRTMDVPTLGDVGRAEFIEGFPVIMLDPVLLTTLPANLQTFFKLHECAHHVLGHLFAPTVESEKQADCWAIKEGRKRKTFSHDDILGWKPHFAASLGSQMGHLPGPERVVFLVGCFDEPH